MLCCAASRAQERDARPDFELDIFLPPIIECRRLASGAHRFMLLGLFHKTTRPDGRTYSFHVLNYFEGPNYKVLFPLGFSRKRADGAKQILVFPTLYRQTEPDGHSFTAIPIFLSAHRTGERLDKRKFQWWPFSFQRAGDDDVEFNFLWRLIHYRREAGARRWIVGPFFYGYRPRPGVPMRAMFLCGLVARDCNYRTGRYRYRFLWGICGRPRRFAPGRAERAWER